ncbi:MAG: T9SS type A sorting domain-containing protein [Calditrichaeota bacterium]|nr:T9SS type A sorting domain-containing protein [Calditrichota bacterium]
MIPQKSIRLLIVSALLILLPLLAIFFDFHFQKLNREQHRMSGAMEALNFWTRLRAYPYKDIPADKYFKAFQKTQLNLRKTNQLPTDLSPWQSMGPHNVPGRMISLAVNPKNQETLYAGGASGGLWRTYKASTGENWHRVHTGFPTLGVMAIAIDPVDTNKIYIGTGEVYGYKRSIGGTVIRTTRGSYGIGILKTSDGGATWEKSLDWTQHQERGVQCIEINPLNENSVLAATSEGIYKSVDGGKSWQLVLDAFMGEDIVIHPTDTTKIMVSCGNLGSANSGIYRSTDAGMTWKKLNGVPNFSGKTLIEAYAANPDIVFASVADSLSGIGLYRTDNFGDTWTLVNDEDVPRYQGFFAHWVAVHPNDLNQVIHAGVNIYKSHDGGYTLNSVYGPHVDHHNYAHDPQNPDIIYIACDGGVYRSTDFGDSYQNIGYGLQTAQFYNGFSNSASDSNLAMGGLQDNNTAIYLGSKDWNLVIGGDGCWTAINQLDDNILYGEYQYNSIQKSLTRGQSFSSATNGMRGAAAFVAPYVISPSNPSVLYSGRQVIFKTIDGAQNWFATNNSALLDGNFALSMAVAARNPDIVYVGTAPLYTRANIFKTTNGGDNWMKVTNNLPDRYPMDIAIDPDDANTVYVVFAGFGAGHVFKTTDAGISWTDITGSLPDVPTLAIAIDPLNSNHVYVGNDVGVYASTDGGNSWQNFNEGLPEAVMAMDLSISPANRNIRVATHGNGVYQRPLLFKPTIYLVYALSQIPTAVLAETPLQFSVNATNQGSEPLSETATVMLRVIDPAKAEVYSNSQQFSDLQAKETKTVTFAGELIPHEIGEYEIQFIDFGTASQPKNDTTRQSMNVTSAPTLASATVRKEYRAYEEIIGGSQFSFGDDDYATVNLPFPFTYDLYQYDKIQICANGWCEFGTGAAGSERGVSTSNQLGSVGANENGRLASTSRPSKALGPWWEDLNPDGGGKVSYRTLGSAPNRVLVIQWKNMRAYWDPSTTTRVNFQVRLYETSNVIEYHYGQVQAGTFSGQDLGAMIGFKDHIGGSFHFYDIAGNGIESASEIVTNLSPLTDWPGPDSCFVIQTLTTGISENKPELPSTIALYQNYPNPFNPTTTIRYDLPATTIVNLKIYNSLGQEVRALVRGVQSAGRKMVVWDGKDDSGFRVTSGVYFYRLEASNEIQIRKMAILK